MKTIKKKKLAVIGIAGMLYSATPASAQTFYQCMPMNCKAGEYASGGSCERCTGGYRCPGDNKRYACTGEWEYAFPGSSKCSTFGPSDIKNMGLWVGAGGCSNKNNFGSIYVSLHRLKVANNKYYNFAVRIPHYEKPANPKYAIYFNCNTAKDAYKIQDTDEQIGCSDIQKVLFKNGGGGCFSLKQVSREFPSIAFVPDDKENGNCMCYWEDNYGKRGINECDKCN